MLFASRAACARGLLLAKDLDSLLKVASLFLVQVVVLFPFFDLSVLLGPALMLRNASMQSIQQAQPTAQYSTVSVYMHAAGHMHA